MKKFFTNVPLQPEGKLDSYRYRAMDSVALDLDSVISFPILTAMAGYVQEGEEIALYAVCPKNENAIRNLATLKNEVKALCEDRKFTCDIRLVSVEDDSGVSNNVDIFQTLVDCIESQDELFACITYGTKPNATALSMALQYGYRILDNVSITCLVYGEIDRNTEDKTLWFGKVYDMTAMIKVDEVVRLLADKKVNAPREALRAILTV